METHIYTTPTSVICIDEETGKAVWRLSTKQISTILEAGEKMAKQLKDLRGFQEETEARGQSSITVETEYIFNTEDAAALKAWEAAKK